MSFEVKGFTSEAHPGNIEHLLKNIIDKTEFIKNVLRNIKQIAPEIGKAREEHTLPRLDNALQVINSLKILNQKKRLMLEYLTILNKDIENIKNTHAKIARLHSKVTDPLLSLFEMDAADALANLSPGP